jgi:Transposase zinc-binding domain
MNRPPLEVADIVRSAGQSFVERSRKWINGQHEKVLLAITRCRTAALGGHRDQCSDCGHTAISYNSCRNRHCPKCQGNARLRWLQARERELLPARYVHVVFTLPRELAPLALQNKRLIYNLLFHASAATLLQIARDPRHLGAEIGFFSVLHTWTSDYSIIPMSTACWPPAVSLRTCLRAIQPRRLAAHRDTRPLATVLPRDVVNHAALIAKMTNTPTLWAGCTALLRAGVKSANDPASSTQSKQRPRGSSGSHSEK